MSEAMVGDVQAVADFARNGFAVVDGISTPSALDELRRVYDGMLEGSIPCSETDRQLGGVTRQILRPHLYHPIFENNAVLERARELSKLMLGVAEPEFTFSMLIYKPAGHPHATPWHQDMAYGGMPITPMGISLDNNAIVQFWLALDDVDETMGCMEFIPSPPDNPMFPHHVASGDPSNDSRLLAITDPESHIDLSKSVKCPLRAGSATVHGYTTPHYTGPNRGMLGRRAYIFTFANPAKLQRAREDIGLSV